MIPGLHAIAQLATLRFVDSLLEGACVAVFAALVLRFARRQSSAVRFAVGFSALIAIAVLPFFRILSQPASNAGHAAIALPESWALYFLGAWGLVACFGILRLGIALRGLHRIRKDCIPLDTRSLDPLLQSTLASYNINRRFAVCTSDRVRVPTAMGLLKPAIVIPRWVMQELSPAELNQILLHELAHLRRWDDWTNLAQQIVKAVFFFHPAVWWIEKRIALEREMACDEAVLAEVPNPRAYAECLARLAEKSFVRHSIALAQAALGKIRQTSQRVAQILSGDRSANANRSWKPAAAVVATFAIACGVAVSRAPELVAFQNSQPAQVAHSIQPAATAPDSFVARTLPSAMKPVGKNARLAQTSSPQRQPARAIPAKFNVRSPHHDEQIHLLKLSAPAHARLTPAVHLTSSQEGVVPFTETLFVLVDDATATSGQQVYRIQMWHVIVFHPTDDTAAHAPAKQT